MRVSIPVIQNLWPRHRLTLLYCAIAVLTTAALSRLSYGLARLLWLQGPNPAIDLLQRYNEVQYWFAGDSIYNQLKVGAAYPPASHVILWPFLFPSSWTVVRWMWAISSIVGLVWLIYLLLKASKAERLPEKVFLALICLATYATNVTLGNGQLTIHVLAPLTAGLLLMDKEHSEWRSDILASLLFVFALVKPTLSVPFFWIVLFRPGRLRPAILVLFLYIVLALVSAAFQPSDLISLHLDWLDRGLVGTALGSASFGSDSLVGTTSTLEAGESNHLVGYGDVHSLLGMMGLSQWNALASILILLVLGYWTYVHRSIDLWLLLGVSAIVTRVFAYHRVYDDMLILLPMITLFRISKQRYFNRPVKVQSGVLLAIATIAILIPDRLRFLPPPWDLMFKGGQSLVWISLLIFLLYQARQAWGVVTEPSFSWARLTKRSG